MKDNSVYKEAEIYHGHVKTGPDRIRWPIQRIRIGKRNLRYQFFAWVGVPGDTSWRMRGVSFDPGKQSPQR